MQNSDVTPSILTTDTTDNSVPTSTSESASTAEDNLGATPAASDHDSSNLTDNTYVSTAPGTTSAEKAQPSTNNSSDHKTITIEEYEKFNQWIADSKNRNIADILRDMKSNVAVRRQTLVLRRADHKAIAPDEDVAAYQKVYELKNPSGESKNKTFVSDNEIRAYKALDPKFDSSPSFSEITSKVEAMKASGQLNAEGDKTSTDEV